MRRMTGNAARLRAGIPARMSAWIGRRQQELSNRMHATGDERARQLGWEVTTDTGRFGFGARRYRDPRFAERRRPLTAAAAPIDGRDHFEAKSTIAVPFMEAGG